MEIHMDHQFNRQPYQNNRRSARMESAAFICGIISLLSICLVYPTLVCGALGITFALLSRGGEMTCTPKAQAGLVMGCISLGFVIFLLVYTVVFAYAFYGGIEEMMREMYKMMGLDYDMIFSTVKLMLHL